MQPTVAPPRSYCLIVNIPCNNVLNNRVFHPKHTSSMVVITKTFVITAIDEVCLNLRKDSYEPIPKYSNQRKYNKYLQKLTNHGTGHGIQKDWQTPKFSCMLE